MRNKLLSVLFVAFLVVSVFVSCSQESTIENLYHGEVSTITFDLGPATGTAPKKIVSNKGQILVLPSTVDGSLSGWNFDGWTEDGSSPCYSGAYTVKGNVTLTARWKKTVKFVKPVEATSTPSDITVYYGKQFETLPELPNVTGKALETYVWKNKLENGTVITADTIATEVSVGEGTLYPVCVPFFQIKYVDKDGNAISNAPVSDYVVENGKLPNLPKISLDTTAANVKYVYDTWKVSPTDLVVTSATSFTSFTDAIDRTNHELKLYGDKKTIIAIAFDFDGQGTDKDHVRYVDITNTQKYLSATDIFGELLPTATTNTSIEYWYVESEEDKITSTTDRAIKTTDVIVHAKWKDNTFVINYYKNADDAEGSIDPQVFTSATEAKLNDGSSFTRTGYYLSKWSTSSTDFTKTFTTGSNADSVIPYADDHKTINLYAEWELRTYTITYNNERGAMNNNPTTFKMTDTDIALNPLTTDTSIFLGWFTSETNGEYITKITSNTSWDIEVWAEWFEKPNTDGPAMTTATAFTGNSATTSTDGQHLVAVYIEGEKDSIFTTPNNWESEYVDSGKWTEASDGRNVYYLWAYNTYIVKFDKNDGDGTTTMSDLKFTYSKPTTLTDNAFTRTGYTFKEWNTKADGKGTSYANKTTNTNYTTGTDTVTLYAQWTPTKTKVTFTLDITGDYTTSTTYTYDSTATDLPFDLPTTASDAKIIGYYTSDSDKKLYVTTGTDGFVWSAGDTWKTTESNLTLIPKYQVKVEVITGNIPGTTYGKEWADEGMNTLDFVNSAFEPKSGTVMAYTDANFSSPAPNTVPHRVDKWTLYLKLE